MRRWLSSCCSCWPRMLYGAPRARPPPAPRVRGPGAAPGGRGGFQEASLPAGPPRLSAAPGMLWPRHTPLPLRLWFAAGGRGAGLYGTQLRVEIGRMVLCVRFFLVFFFLFFFLSLSVQRAWLMQIYALLLLTSKPSESDQLSTCLRIVEALFTPRSQGSPRTQPWAHRGHTPTVTATVIQQQYQ